MSDNLSIAQPDLHFSFMPEAEPPFEFENVRLTEAENSKKSSI